MKTYAWHLDLRCYGTQKLITGQKTWFWGFHNVVDFLISGPVVLMKEIFVDSDFLVECFYWRVQVFNRTPCSGPREKVLVKW